MLTIACGFLLSISIYLLLEPAIVRRIFGVILLGSTINLIILVCGRLASVNPAFINETSEKLSNPLPQALILTAIVIGFGLLAFLCALLKLLLEANK